MEATLGAAEDGAPPGVGLTLLGRRGVAVPCGAVVLPAAVVGVGAAVGVRRSGGAAGRWPAPGVAAYASTADDGAGMSEKRSWSASRPLTTRPNAAWPMTAPF